MFERSHIERLLRLNSVAITATDEEITAVLSSARWGESDITTALLILKESTKSPATQVDSVHTLYQSDQKLRPELITQLLGIDVDASRSGIMVERGSRKRVLTFFQAVQIIFSSSLLAVVCVSFAMWYFQIGYFHFSKCGTVAHSYTICSKK